MNFERAQHLSIYHGAEDTKTYEGIRMQLSRDISKSLENNDHRLTVILCRRFINAFPASGLVPIERAVRECFREKLNKSKEVLTHICPVCGATMTDTLCPDDIMRPLCHQCGKTYTPLGYDEEDNYALKWGAITWNGAEPYNVIEVQ